VKPFEASKAKVMPGQRDLFAPTPEPRKLARVEHPPTSLLAAKSIAAQLPDLRRRALALVIRFPGRTSRALADIAQDRDIRTIGRRLGELERAHLVKRGPVQKCPITGRLCSTWLPC